MKRLALLALVAASLLAQQPQPAPPPPLAPNEIIRVVEVKNANVSDIRNNLSRLFTGITEANGRLVVRGQAPVVDMIEDAIKKLDVAPPPAPESRPVPNVELTLQLLQGSAAEGQSGTIPPDLESTVKQLRTLFPYKSYKLLDTQILRSRLGGQELSAAGTLPGGPSMFNFYVTPSILQGQTPRSVQLRRLRLDLRQEDRRGNSVQFVTSGINTDIDAKEGQKTVVGKANLVNSEDAIILVITPKVIE